MVVAGVAADTVRLQGEFLAEGIGYFAYAFPIWPRAPQGCEEGLVKGIPAGHYTASKDNKAYAVRAAALLTEGTQRWSTSTLWRAVTNDPEKTHNSQTLCAKMSETSRP